MEIALLIILALGILTAVVVVTRKNDLFVISVKRGRPKLVRGAIRPAILQSFEEVLSRANVRVATIRGVKGDTHIRLVFSGDIDDSTAQRLRNVFGAQRTRGFGGSGSDGGGTSAKQL